VKWWFWLSSTGFFMTGSFSVKFVGLFVVILVGFRAIAELWDILGDLSYPVVISIIKNHFASFETSDIKYIFHVINRVTLRNTLQPELYALSHYRSFFI